MARTDQDSDRRTEPIDKRVWDATLPCPDCGNMSVIGFLYLDQHGRHQHTHYVCTFWAAKDRCGWHGWTVPGWNEG